MGGGHQTRDTLIITTLLLRLRTRPFRTRLLYRLPPRRPLRRIIRSRRRKVSRSTRVRQCTILVSQSYLIL